VRAGLATLGSLRPFGNLAQIAASNLLMLTLLSLGLLQLRGAAALALGARSEARGVATPARRALVIDDDALFARGVAKVLRKQGFAVDLAASAAEAQRLVAEHRYDCIFCDQFLGDGLGTELCDRLLDENARERCVIVSGGDPGWIFEPESNNYGFHAKPCSGNEIANLARRLATA
jgi:hypothetical protein